MWPTALRRAVERRVGNVSWERWLAFLKPGEERPGLWVIRDRVNGEGRHALTWLLHFFPGWITLDDADRQPDHRLWAGHRQPGGGFHQPEGAEFDAVRGQEDPPRGWYSDEYGKLEPAWEVRAERVVDLPYEGYMAFWCPSRATRSRRLSSPGRQRRGNRHRQRHRLGFCHWSTSRATSLRSLSA
jgi:hypothetical protein